MEANTHQSSRANSIRKVSNPWEEAGHCWEMCAGASPSVPAEQHYSPQAQLGIYSAVFNASNSVNSARVQQILPSPCLTPLNPPPWVAGLAQPQCQDATATGKATHKGSSTPKKHLKHLWRVTLEKTGQLISSQHLTLPFKQCFTAIKMIALLLGRERKNSNKTSLKVWFLLRPAPNCRMQSFTGYLSYIKDRQALWIYRAHSWLLCLLWRPLWVWLISNWGRSFALQWLLVPWL